MGLLVGGGAGEGAAVMGLALEYFGLGEGNRGEGMGKRRGDELGKETARAFVSRWVGVADAAEGS